MNATQMYQQLVANQLSAHLKEFATKLSDKHELDQSAVQQDMDAYIKEMDFETLLANYKPKTAKKRNSKPKGPMDPMERCSARVWGTGSGEDQCSRKKKDDCYCSMHSKQYVICPTPATIDTETGKRCGLWLGDIKDELPWKDANNVVRIQWNDTEVVDAAIADGTATLPGKTKKAKKAKKAKKEVEEVEEEVEEPIVISNAEKLAQLGEEVVEVADVEVAVEVAVEDDATEDGEIVENEDEVDVSYETTDTGEQVLVDGKCNVYSDEGVRIGTWDPESKTVTA